MLFFITPFKWLLQWFFDLTQNWGWAIVLLTLTLKVILFPTSIKQFRSMDKMKRIQPKLKEIQDKFKDKPEELQRRMMELYKKENVNPFGSCLPMIIQLLLLWPIFYLLQKPEFGVAELIKTSHFLWFNLGDTKVLYTNLPLAVISGLTTFVQTKLTTPATGAGEQQSQQQIFLYIMPVFIGFMTYNVNAGMALYWITSNVLGIIQQYLINEYFIVKDHIQKDDESDEKENKEIKEVKNTKEIKEVKKTTEIKEVEEVDETKDVKEPIRIEDLRRKKNTTSSKNGKK